MAGTAEVGVAGADAATGDPAAAWVAEGAACAWCTPGVAAADGGVLTFALDGEVDETVTPFVDAEADGVETVATGVWAVALETVTPFVDAEADGVETVATGV